MTIDTAHQLASRLYRAALLPAFALLLLAAAWSAVVYQIGQERAAALGNAVNRSQTLARTLADHTSYLLRQSDHATQLFKLQFEQSGGALRLAEFTRDDGLLDSVLPSRLDLPLALLDAGGRVIDSANAFLPANLAGQGFFREHAGNPADTALFGTPVLEPRTGKWQVRVSRRLNDRQGRFAGVIVMLIDPATFVNDYDLPELGAGDALLLVSRDSALAIGRVDERLLLSDKLDFHAADDPAHPAAELLIRQPFDDTARIYSYRDMPRYPLLAVVGVTEAGAMAPFARQRTLYLGAMALASALILGFTALLMQQSGRLRRSMRAAEEAEAMRRAATHASLDAVLLLRAWRPAGAGQPVQDFIFADLNERAAAMLGQPRAALLGQRLGQCAPLLHQAHFFPHYLQVLASGQPLEEEFELPATPGQHLGQDLGQDHGQERGDGQARWLQQQIVALGNGVAVTARDISERKRAELALRRNRSFLQSLIDYLPLAIYVKSAQPDNFGQIVVWNTAAELVTGYGADQVIGQRDSQSFAPGFAPHSAENERAMLAGRGALDVPDQPYPHPDGTLRHLHTVSVPLFDERDLPEYILCIAEDVSGRRKQEQALRQNQAELAAVSDASPLGLIRLGPDALCTYVNRTFESITGLSREEALERRWTRAVHPDDLPALLAGLDELRRSRQPFQAVLRCLQKDGRVVWVSAKLAAIQVDGVVEGYVGSLDDITTLRESDMALRASESRLRTIADALPAMIAYVDANQVYRFHNLAYEREFSQTGLHVLGKTVRETMGEARYQALAPQLARVLAGETVRFEEEDEEGERCLEVNYIPQHGQDGVSVIGLHVMRQDITMQKREKRRLLKLTQIDPMTGLVNRSGFLQRLADAMRYCQDNRSTMAVMFMDIDRFKPVNDNHGHNVGDALLKAFSARLTQAMRASDTIARIGGDEFTIIVEKIGKANDACALAAKIVGTMQAPFDLDGIVVSISASIGVAFYRDDPLTPAALLKQADVLLYQAKQAGRNTYRAGPMPA